MAYLEIGSSGPEVTELQNKLVEQGCLIGDVDGDFGHKTAAAVAYFQSSHGLGIDAVVGPQVRELLNIGAAGISCRFEVKWPEIEVWHPGDELAVEITPISEVDSFQMCVVIWYRSEAGERYSAAQVTVNDTAATIAHVPLNAFTPSTMVSALHRHHARHARVRDRRPGHWIVPGRSPDPH